MSAITQSTVAESPLATEPDAFTVYYAELEIGGTDVVTVRFALREFFTESAPLAVAATTTTSNRHDYITDAVMYSADSGYGYEFNKLTLTELANSGGIPLGPLTVNTIGDEQYIGYQNVHWNRDPAVFEVNFISFEQRVRGFISSAPLELGLTGTAVYREAVRLNVVDNINLNVQFTELNYFFADPDRTISPGIPFGPISVNSIAQEQFIGYQNIRWNREPAPLEISVSSFEQRVRGFISTTSLVIGLTDIAYYREAVRLNVVDTIALDLGVTELHYFFADADRTISPGIPVGPISVNTIAQEQFIGHQFNHWNRDPAPLEINATIVEKRIFNRPVDTAPLEVDVTFTAYKRDAVRLDVTDPAVLVVGSNELHYSFPGADPERGVPLPIGPVSTAAIADLHYVASEYPQSFFALVTKAKLFITAESIDELPSPIFLNAVICPLVITATSEFKRIVSVTSSANLAVVDIQSIETTRNTTDSVELVLSATSVAIRTFARSAIAPIEIDVVSAHSSAKAVATTTPLVVSATSTAIRTFARSSTAPIEIAATAVERRSMSRVTVGAIEVDAIATNARIVKVVDTVALAVNATTSVNQIVDVVSTTALVVSASAVVIKPYVVSSTTDNEIAATTTIKQIVNVVSAANLAVVDIDATKVILVRENVLALEIAATVIERRSMSRITVGAIEVAATDVVTRGYERITTGELNVAGTTANSIRSENTATTAVELAATTQVSKAFSLISTTDLEIAATTVAKHAYTIDSTANLAVVDIDATQVRFVKENTGVLEIDVTSVVKKSHAVATTANLAVVDIQSVEIASNVDNTVALAFGVTAAVSRTVVFTGNALFIELEASAIEKRVYARSSTGSVELDATASNSIVSNSVIVTPRPFKMYGETSNTIVSNNVNDAVLEIPVTSVVKKSHSIISVANLAVVDIQSVEYITELDNTIALEIAVTDVVKYVTAIVDTVAIELSHSDAVRTTIAIDDVAVLAVVDIQSIEYITELDNTVALELAVTDVVKYVTIIDDTIATELSATSVVVKSFSVVAIGNLEINATSGISQIAVIDDDAELALVDIVSTSSKHNINDVEFCEFVITDVIKHAYAIDSTAVLAVVDIQSIEYSTEIDNTIALEVAATDVVTAVFKSVETTNVEIEVTDVIVKVFAVTSVTDLELAITSTVKQIVVLDDTAELALVDIVSVTVKHDINDVEFCEFIVTDVVKRIRAINDTAVLALVDIQSVEYSTEVDNTIALEVTATAVITQTFAFTDTAAFEIAASDTVQQIFQYGLYDYELITDAGDALITDAGDTLVTDGDTGIIIPLFVNSTSAVATIVNIDDNAAFEIAATDVVSNTRAYATEVALEITDTTNVSAAHVFADTGTLAIVDIQSVAIASNVDNDVALDFAATAAIEQLFVFASTAATSLADSNADSLVSAIANTLAVEIAATDVVKQIVSIDDSAVLALVDIVSTSSRRNIDDIEFLEFVATDTVSKVSAFDDSAVLALVDIQSIEYSSNVEDSSFLELAATETVEQRISYIDTAAVEITATAVVVQTFAFIDTAVLALVDIQSIEYTSNVQDSSFLELAATETVEQRLNYADNAVVEITANAIVSQTYAFADSAALALVDIQSIEYSSNIEDSSFLELAATDSVKKVSEIADSADAEIAVTFTTTTIYAFADSANLAVVDIQSIEYISNIEDSSFLDLAASEAVEQRFNYADTTDVEIAAEEVISTAYIFADNAVLALVDIQSIEYTSNVQDSSFLDLAATEAIEQRFNYVDTAAVEITSTFVFSKSFSIDDTAVLALVDIVSTEITSNVETVQFFELEAITAIQQIFVVDNTIDTELDAQSTVKLVHVIEDTAVLAVVDIVANEITSNVETIQFFELAATDIEKRVFNYPESANVELYDKAIKVLLGVPQVPFGYTKIGDTANIVLAGEDRNDGQPGDIASLLKAIDEKVFAPNRGQRLSIDGSPFVYYGTISDILVEQQPDSSYSITISVTDALNGPQDGPHVTGTGILLDNTQVTDLGIVQIRNYGTEVGYIADLNGAGDNAITSFVESDADAEVAAEELIQIIFNYVDTSDSEIDATVTVSRAVSITDNANLAVVDIDSVEITSNVETIQFFELEATATVQKSINFYEFAAAEVAAEAAVAVVHAYDDSANLAVVDIDSVEITSNVETVQFFELTAEDIVKQSFNVIDTSDNEVDANVEVSIVYSYADTTNLAVVDIVSNEITSNVETVQFVELAAEEAIEQRFNFVDTTELVFAADVEVAVIISVASTSDNELDSIASNTVHLNYVDDAVLAVINIQSISVKYNYNDIPFVTYNIDTAIEQIFNFVEVFAVNQLGAEVATSMTMVMSNVTATDLMAEASNTIVSNVVEDPQLDIAAEYLTQSSRSDISSSSVDLDVIDNLGVTRMVYSVDHIGDIMGYSFAKGYTLFKQEYSNEPVPLSLGAVSGEIQVISGGGQPVTSSKQIWIG